MLNNQRVNHKSAISKFSWFNPLLFGTFFFYLPDHGTEPCPFFAAEAPARNAGAMTQERVPGHQKPPRGRTMAAATRFEKAELVATGANRGCKGP